VGVLRLATERATNEPPPDFCGAVNRRGWDCRISFRNKLDFTQNERPACERNKNVKKKRNRARAERSRNQNQQATTDRMESYRIQRNQTKPNPTAKPNQCPQMAPNNMGVVGCMFLH